MPDSSPSPKSRTDGFDLARNFSRHKLDLFTKYRGHFLLFCLSAAADAASTQFFMRLVGHQVESNFYVRVLSHYYGYTAGPLLGKLYQLFALWGFSILAPRLTRFVCIMIIAINFTAAIVNYATYLKKPPGSRRGPPPVFLIELPASR